MSEYAEMVDDEPMTWETDAAQYGQVGQARNLGERVRELEDALRDAAGWMRSIDALLLSYKVKLLDVDKVVSRWESLLNK